MKHRHAGRVVYKTRNGRFMTRLKPLHTTTVHGKVYNIYKSNRKGKEYMVDSGKGIVHFADPTMPEYPGTKRGDNYCARSSGIKGTSDMTSANYWSRKLWSCKGKRSISKRRFI